MKKILIIGNSAGSTKIIEQVRSVDKESEITLITYNGQYPCMREAFSPLLAKEILPEQVFTQAKDFYAENNINLILDKKVTRINVKRKKIYTEDKGQIDFDVLIITELPENKFPDIKGTKKAGVFGFKKLIDIDQMINHFLVTETVVVQSDTITGLQAASAFVKRDKEVVVITSESDFIGQTFDDDVARWLISELEQAGIQLIRASHITEILGDKEVKAVRLDSGKVYSAQIILFCETGEDFRLFSESELKIDRKIEVDAQFQTSINGVFAIDQVCSQVGVEPVTPCEILDQQAKIVAAAIAGEDYSAENPVLIKEFKVEGLSISVLGNTTGQNGCDIRWAFDQELKTYKKLYLKGNYLVGAVLVNLDAEKMQLFEAIQAKTQIELEIEEQSSPESSADLTDDEPISTQNVSTELVDN